METMFMQNLEVQTKSILVFLKVAYVALNFCGFGLGFVTIPNFFVVRIINSVFKFLKSGINKFIFYEIHIHMFCFQKYHNTLCLSLHNFASVLLLFSLGTKVSPRRNNVYAKFWRDKQRVFWYF